MGIILRPHQIPVVDYAIKNPYFICSVGVGGGKGVITPYLQDKLGCKMLVICPSYLISNWVDKINQYYNGDKRVTVVRHKNDVYDLWDTDICLASYEWVKDYKPLFRWADFVVAEEGHYLKNLLANRTMQFHKMLYETGNPRMMILTGTPIKSKTHEFYSLMALCYYNPKLKKPEFLEKYPDTETFADNFSYRIEYDARVFSQKYARMITTKIVKYEGIRNKEELRQYLKGIYIRVNRDEYMKTEKPVFNNVMVQYKDNPALQEAFEHFVETKQCNTAIKRESAMAKIPFTIKYIEDLLESIENVVVFTDYVDVCEAIAAHFGVEAITGKMAPEKRYEISLKFQAREINLIMATTGSFSTGIDLFAAKDMVFNDIPWIPGDLTQAIARVDRDGQTERCIVHLMSGSYQDKAINENMLKAQEVIDSIT